MKSILALALTFMSFNQAHAASPMRRDSSGNVYVASVELKDDKGREVLIAGMSHLAPTRFYDAEQALIEKWIGADKSNLLVMREFLTCSTQVLDNPEQVPQATIESIVSKSSLFKNPVNFLNAKDAEAQPIASALALKPTACRIDLDQKTKRPSYIVDRNENWCAQANSHGASCQFEKFNSFLGTLNYIDADLQVDSMSPAVQVAAASLYRTGVLGENRWNVNRFAASTQAFLQPGMFLLIEGRNQLLLAGVANAFASNVKRLLLPWGAEHTLGLIDALKKQGFHVVKVNDVLLGDISDIGKLPLIDQTLTSPTIPDKFGI